MIYKTLYGNQLDFSKICDNVMNDEIKLTYLLFNVTPNGSKRHKTDITLSYIYEKSSGFPYKVCIYVARLQEKGLLNRSMSERLEFTC